MSTFEKTCAKISVCAKKDIEDEFGYLPAEKEMTMELKKLVRRYAPISYADYDIAQLINEFDSISDRSTDQKYTIIMNGSGTWYQFFKNNLYTATSWTDLFSIKKKYIDEEIYTTRCNEMWNKIKEIREAISWELQPALEAQLAKASAPAAAAAPAAASAAASAAAASAAAAAASDDFYKFPAVGGAGAKKAISVKETVTHECECKNCYSKSWDVPFNKFEVAKSCKCFNCGIINDMDGTKSVSKLVQIEYILSKSSFTKKELKHLMHIMCEKAKEKDMCHISSTDDWKVYQVPHHY